MLIYVLYTYAYILLSQFMDEVQDLNGTVFSKSMSESTIPYCLSRDGHG